MQGTSLFLDQALLTYSQASQGYFQPDVGGANIPVSQGELSDLAGDEPLFKALYKWWVFGCILPPTISNIQHTSAPSKHPW
jgi:hypothetical protein